MKIIKQTVTELMFQTRGVFDFWLPSCLLIAFGLISLSLNYNVASLRCDRLKAKEGTCQLTRSDWLGSKTQEIQLSALQGAKVENIGYTSRVLLLTDVGVVPFTGKCTYWGKQEAMAYDINYYVKNTKQKLLNFTQDDRWLGSLGALFFASGIGIIVFASSETYSLDRSVNSLTVKHRRWWGSKVIKHSLSNISGVEIQQTKDRDNDTWYEVRLLVSQGDKLSLPSTMNRYQSAKIAKVINNYLSQRASEVKLFKLRDARYLDEVFSDSQLTHPNSLN